jgi:hypothetical protein
MMELVYILRVKSFRVLPSAGRRKCRKLARSAGRCSQRSPSSPWRYHLRIRPPLAVAVEDMAAEVAVMEVAVSTAAAEASMVAAAFMVAEAFTAAAPASVDPTAGDFMAGDLMAEDFAAAPMPFMQFPAGDAVSVRVTFKPGPNESIPSRPAPNFAPPAPAMHVFLKARWQVAAGLRTA